MTVFVIVGTIFFEMLLAAVAGLAFLLLGREFHRRKEPGLLWVAGSFALLTASALAMYAGHSLAAFGNDAAEPVLRAATAAFSGFGALLSVGITLLLRLRARKTRVVVGASLGLVGIYAAVFQAGSLQSAFGMQFVGYDMLTLAIVAAAPLQAFWLVTLASVVRRLKEIRAKRRPAPADRILLNAGLWGLLFLLLGAVTVVLQLPWMAMIDLAFLTGAVGLAFFGAATVTHQEQRVRESPKTLFTRSLIFKAVALNSIIFWLLALALVAVTSSYYVTASMRANESGLRRDIHYFSKAAAGQGLALLEEVTRIASSDAAVRSLISADEDVPEEVATELRRRTLANAGIRIVRVIDADGIIVFSSHSSEERGQRFTGSRVVDGALDGRKIAAVERENSMGEWAMRAAAPVRRADGSTAGVVLDTYLRDAFNFSDYAAVSPIFAAGYGFVSESGEQAFWSGQPIDAVARMALYGKQLSAFDPVVTERGRTFYLKNVFDTDGNPNGFFYAFLTDEMLDAEVFRGIAAVTLLAVMAVALMTLVLLFCLTLVLHPIRKLREVAAKMEKEEYDMRIPYESADELGQLAAAFVHMQGRVADRTSALRDIVREKQDFLDNTVRELQAPMHIFRWTIEMFRFGDTGRLNKEQLELLEQLHQTNERLLRVVQNLQDAIQIERHKLTLKLEDVQAEDLIDEAAGSSAVSARKKNITLHWTRPKEPLPKVRADVVALRKVLGHLVNNAVKYSGQNGLVEINAEFDPPRSGGRGGMLRVTVSDHGIGIPEGEMKKLFTRFFRGSNVMGAEADGTGLGLYISKRLVDMHRGTLSVESVQHKGTTVTFTLPVADPAAPAKKPA